MPSPLSPISEGGFLESKHRPKTYQKSSQIKNRKSRIRYTRAEGNPWIFPTQNPSLPSSATQQAMNNLPDDLQARRELASKSDKGSRKAQSHPESLLISRPSFLGDFRALAAYYQNENKSNSELKVSGPAPPSETSASTTSKPPAFQKTQPAQPSNLERHMASSLRAASQARIESGQGVHGHDKIPAPRRPIRAEPTIIEVGEGDEIGLSEFDQLPGTPPHLELPFFGADRHIGCRFSVRTLTREVERGLKSHEPLSRKQQRNSKAYKLLSCNDKSKILNRTRKDLGMRSRRHQDAPDLSSIPKSIDEFEDSGPIQSCEDESTGGEDSDLDSDLEWSDVERIFARLPTSLVWEDKNPGGVPASQSPQFEDLSSCPSSSSEISPQRLDQNSRLRDSPRHPAIPPADPEPGTFQHSPARPNFSGNVEAKCIPKTSTKTQVINSAHSKALPALVPQPWARVRAQQRNTVRFAPTPIHPPMSYLPGTITTESTRKESQKHFTISNCSSSSARGRTPPQSSQESWLKMRNTESGKMKPVLKPLQIPGIGSQSKIHSSGIRSAAPLNR